MWETEGGTFQNSSLKDQKARSGGSFPERVIEAKFGWAWTEGPVGRGSGPLLESMAILADNPALQWQMSNGQLAVSYYDGRGSELFRGGFEYRALGTLIKRLCVGLGCSSAVELLPGMSEALGSSLSPGALGRLCLMRQWVQRFFGSETKCHEYSEGVMGLSDFFFRKARQFNVLLLWGKPQWRGQAEWFKKEKEQF